MDLAAQQSSIQRPHTVAPPPQSSPQHPRHDLPNMTQTTRSWGGSSTLLPTTRLPATHFSTQSPAHGRLHELCPQHSSGRQQHLPAPVATAERHHFTYIKRRSYVLLTTTRLPTTPLSTQSSTPSRLREYYPQHSSGRRILLGNIISLQPSRQQSNINDFGGGQLDAWRWW